jgi:hypothetical protein
MDLGKMSGEVEESAGENRSFTGQQKRRINILHFGGTQDDCTVGVLQTALQQVLKNNCGQYKTTEEGSVFVNPKDEVYTLKSLP